MMDDFLMALEAATQSPNLAPRVARALERMIIEQAEDAPWPLMIGSTQRAVVEVTQPLRDIAAIAGEDRVNADIPSRVATLVRSSCR